MEGGLLNTFVEVAKALGALATPVVVVIVAYLFQRRQKVAEAAMAERIKRIALISPLLNRIFSYRHRVGAYLDWSPEEVLQAKREADREFRTYEFLWSPEYREAYHRFMEECFSTNRARETRRVSGPMQGTIPKRRPHPIGRPSPARTRTRSETRKPTTSCSRSRPGTWDSETNR